MPKRKLVEISSAHHQQIQNIRKFLKKQGRMVPSVPSIVSEALESSLQLIFEKYTASK